MQHTKINTVSLIFESIGIEELKKQLQIFLSLTSTDTGHKLHMREDIFGQCGFCPLCQMQTTTNQQKWLLWIASVNYRLNSQSRLLQLSQLLF